MNFYNKNKHFNAILCSVLLLCLFSCNLNHNNNLDEYQKTIMRKIKANNTSKNFFKVHDTIFIKLNEDLIFDTDPIVCATLDGYVIANPFMKKNVIIDSTGSIIKIFGSDGEGPGEFRNIQSVCVDEKDNIFLYDNLLGRLTKYNYKGHFISFLNVKELSQYIRHICAYKDYVFFHHAPAGDFNGYVTRFDSVGNSKTFLHKLNRYNSYYERGFLDGTLIRDDLGNIYETNTYDLLIKKIFDSEEEIFNNDELDLKILSSTKKTDYNSLIENYRKAAIPLNMYLINNDKIIIQEILSFSTNNKKVNRQMLFYDTKGVFLGRLNIDAQYSFDSSDGKYLLKLIDPSLYPNVFSDAKSPFIIRYEMK